MTDEPTEALVSRNATAIPFRLPAWIPWAAATGLALTAAWLGREFVRSREQLVLLRTEAQFAEIARRDAQNHLAAERIVLNRQLADLAREAKGRHDLAELKIATLHSLPGHSPSALAVAVWNPAGQEGILSVENLPATPSDQDYEVWMIDPQQAKPLSGGVFTVGTDGRARVHFKPEAPVTTVAKFAVSRENKGGAPRLSGPQGEMILISQ